MTLLPEIRGQLEEAVRERASTSPSPMSQHPRRFPRPRAGGVIALVSGLVAVLVALVALTSFHGAVIGPDHQAGSQSATTGAPRSATSSTSHPGSTTGVGVTVASVERALLRHTNQPRPTAVSCRAPTASERARAEIGGADSAFFSCRISRDGQAARFYVQVILSTGSFIAEPERRGPQQIFGCCVPRPSR